MAQLSTCPQGHRWQSGAVCPVCGAKASAVLPPTLASEMLSSPADEPDSDSGDRTFLAGAVQAAPSTGRTVPGYEILGELGRGGMGVVYKARHLRLNRVVALKMILSGAHASPQELARFRAEAEAVAPLQHPNIVQIYEVGEHDGHPFFSLEFVEGGSLAQQLDGFPQPARWSAQLIDILARAIHYAHTRGIVHRDLKPANVLLASGGRDPLERSFGDSSSSLSGARSELPMPKITDFGLAKRLDDSAGPTKTGAVLGTPSYIAPEQAAGRKDIGPAVDIYALGAILYELLTGRPPFRGETSMDTMLQVMTDEPVPPTRLQPKVPRDLETICLKCLQKPPAKRYVTAEALADDLRRFLNSEPIQARAISLMGRSVKWARRRPAIAALIGVIVLALLSLFGASFWHNIQLQRAYRLVEMQNAEAQAQRQMAEMGHREAQNQQQRAMAAQRLAEDRVEHSRRSLYAFQLMQVANQLRSDPVTAAKLLNDPERCPKDLRDFTWSYLDRLSRRERREWQGAKGVSPALAVSANGKTIASAGDGTVLLLPIDGGQSASFPTNHRDSTVAVAFSPDGRTLATGSFDHNVKLWDRSGKEIGLLEGHTDGVRAVAFSSDGKELASGSHDRTIILWDQAGRKPRATFKGHTSSVSAVAFSPDSKVLATAAADGTVRLWDVASGKPLTVLRGHTGEVRAVAFAPSGKLLASAGTDRSIRLWDAVERKPLDSLHGHLDAVNGLAFSPDGKTLASASADSTVRLWQPATGELRTTLRHVSPLKALSFTGRNLLAVLGNDRSIKLWDIDFTPDRDLRRIDFGVAGKQTPVTAFAKDGRTLAVANRANQNIQMHDLLGGKDWVVVQNFTRPVDCVAVSPDGKLLAAGADDQTIRLYDSTGRPKGILKGHKGRIAAIAFADPRTLISGGMDGTVRQWDAVTAELIDVPVTHQAPIHSLAVSPDGSLAASAADDRSVKLYYIRSRTAGPSITGLAAPVRLLAFSPDAKTLALGDGGRTVQLWSVPDRRVRATLQAPSSVRCLTFSPDSKVLATGHADWAVMLWDGLTGQERAKLPGHTSPIHAVSFSDGKTLISLDDGGGVRMTSASVGR